mmetsp:Transcript_20325/g.43050  ORF Transcript_20325/g.43050 Transcript_20325/m.43050 type:complete len:241 (+) Transcript_20325:47-769(+)
MERHYYIVYLAIHSIPFDVDPLLASAAGQVVRGFPVAPLARHRAVGDTVAAAAPVPRPRESARGARSGGVSVRYLVGKLRDAGRLLAPAFSLAPSVVDVLELVLAHAYVLRGPPSDLRQQVRVLSEFVVDAEARAGAVARREIRDVLAPVVAATGGEGAGRPRLPPELVQNFVLLPVEVEHFAQVRPLVRIFARNAIEEPVGASALPPALAYRLLALPDQVLLRNRFAARVLAPRRRPGH